MYVGDAVVPEGVQAVVEAAAAAAVADVPIVGVGIVPSGVGADVSTGPETVGPGTVAAKAPVDADAAVPELRSPASDRGATALVVSALRRATSSVSRWASRTAMACMLERACEAMATATAHVVTHVATMA